MDKIPLTLDSSGLKLWKLEDGSLVLKYPSARGDRRAVLGPVRRALPLSDPERWIIFSDCDGAEIGVLRAIDDMDLASQAVLREALKAEYTLERVVKILKVEREPLSGQTHWRVQIANDEEVEPVEASASDGSRLEGAPSPDASTSDASTSSAGSNSVSVSKADADGASMNGAGNSRGAAEADGAGREEQGGEEGEARTGTLGKVASLLSLGRDRSVAEDSGTFIEREFTIAGQEDVATARYPHIFIVDTERRRYEIPNCEALDTESRKVAERFF